MIARHMGMAVTTMGLSAELGQEKNASTGTPKILILTALAGTLDPTITVGTSSWRDEGRWQPGVFGVSLLIIE